MLYWAAVVFFCVITASVAFLLAMALYNLFLVLRYRARRGPDPDPSGRFAEAGLPRVTVQLPTYNEGELARQSLRLAAALDYPPGKLEIQLLDDSDDIVTSEIAREEADRLSVAHPEITFSYFHRDSREGFKSGALLNGVDQATGDYFAIFDADFVIPSDYLRRTIHYFTDPAVGAVQARWDYVNHDTGLFTRLQANKLDSHQMFEQTARARSDMPVIFHGTAGIWRASALEEAGGWACMSEVEDVEVTIRATMKGWRIVYLDHFRLLSELPETVTGYVRQQMRWKRGWTRVVLNYTGHILSGSVSWRDRLDLLLRIHLSWGPVFALTMTLGVLPYFMISDRLGLSVFATLLYLTSLAVSLLNRHFESKTLTEDWNARAPIELHPLLRPVPLNYLLFSLGMLWPLTQATFEGFGRSQVWEVTPKTTTTVQSSGHFVTGGSLIGLPGYVLGTLGLCLAGALLSVASVILGHPLAALFNSMLSIGTGWLGLRLLGDMAAMRRAAEEMADTA